MSLRVAVRAHSQALSESQQLSVLPFLYQTRTLLSSLRTGRQSVVQRDNCRLRKNLSSTKASRASYKPLEPVSDLESRGADELSPFSPRWSAASKRNAPYQAKSLQWSLDTEQIVEGLEHPREAYKSPSNVQQPSQVQEGQAPSSTITASEKAVFHRIFSEISKTAAERDQASAREQEEEEYLEQDSVGEEDVSVDPREQLVAIFNLATTRQMEQERLAFQGDFKQNASVIDRSYERAISLSSDSLGRATFKQRRSFSRSDLEQALPVTDEETQAAFKRASDDHRQFVDSLLNAANTDVEIWAILEKEVFNLMTQLNAQTKLEDRARKADLRRQKQAAKMALDNQNNTSKPGEPLEGAHSPATESLHPPRTSSADSKALPTNALLSLLQSNYAHHCLHALRLFRNLRLSSPYALHLLPHIKSLGPVSYVLGASTDLYNEILFQKWTQFSDVQGMADLMEEMVNQGISANVTTLEFLRFVDRSRRLDLRGQRGTAKRTWWALRPVREGWTRVKALYARFMDEMGEAGEWDRKAMKAERRTLLRSKAVEHVWMKERAGGGEAEEGAKMKNEGVRRERQVFRKLITEAPLLKMIPSDRKDKPVPPSSVRGRARRRMGSGSIAQGDLELRVRFPSRGVS